MNVQFLFRRNYQEIESTMSKQIACISTYLLICFCVSIVVSAESLQIDETPAAEEEWGFRPGDGTTIEITPPGFVWRPQKEAKTYEIQCSTEPDFSDIEYCADGIVYNVHTPPHTFSKGRWFWRFRYLGLDGEVSEWSRVRSFTITENARELPLPRKEDLLARIPKTHPRLFVRPEQIQELRRRAKTDLKLFFQDLVEESEDLLRNPPPTEEPPLYPEGMERNSDEWREIWWGNRRYTTKALNGAATLAFTRLMGGKEEYGELARKILMDCAEWDPKGSTGYRYNDEAGMPYNYYFSRTYTFLHDLLSEQEREKCQKVMRIRGEEMYRHLYPNHLWRPYASHRNRAWHFLGEIGVAFLDEIPEADEWAWFAANVFRNVYPVWCDEYGGWHEGLAYWRSYIRRFTWWADIMRVAMDINAYDMPYFSQVGYYPMYLQPPGTEGGGFGDLTARLDSGGNKNLMAIFAAQAQNPYWQWYVEAHGGAHREGGYISFIRGALPPVEAKSPADLPTSRCFWGVGQAMLNTNLLDAENNVEIIFKSSPFGTQSHGYESQNAFLLYAFGERLLIRTGRRDSYGSKHHKQWMWKTKSVNSVTVNGEGLHGHSAREVGKIIDFETGPIFDYVSGEAEEAYGDLLNRFTRRILFIKPKAVVIFDTLTAPEPSTFEWLLHAPTEMSVESQNQIQVENGGAACRVNLLWPENLKLSQTSRFDPPPRPRIKLVEYHLTAQTSSSESSQDFITVIRPHRVNDELTGEVEIETVDGRHLLRIPCADGDAVVLLQTDGRKAFSIGGFATDAEVASVLFDSEGNPLSTFVINGSRIQIADR